MTWADVAVAGAFVLGLIAGGLAVTRVTRLVMDYLRSDEARRRKDRP